MDKVTEAINLEADLLLKLTPLSEAEIFEFMKNLRGGTYFNMGMYSSIPVSKAYKSSIRIYKVIDLTAIVSGVSYENVGTTKDFRQATGEGPGKSWYDHTPGFENKVGQKKSDPNSKYVLWDIKRGTGTCVRYYVVDIDTGAVTPVSKDDVLQSDWLTQTEKNKLMPKPVVGIDLTTGQAVENKTVWRTAAFDHIFWLNQAGKSTQEYGVRFEEDFSLTEAAADELFMDAHAFVKTDLDAILSGAVIESVKKPVEEDVDTDIFLDAHAGVKAKLDDVLSGAVTKVKTLKESEDDEDDFYEDVIELLDPSGIGQKKVLTDTYIKDILNDPTVEDSDKEKFKQILASEELLDEVFEAVTEALYDSVELSDYISDYSAYELSDMDGPWNTVMDIVNECLWNFVKRNLQEGRRTKGLKESYRRIVSRGKTLVDNELFIDFE